VSSKATSLVSQAKQWASYYGDYPNGKEGAVLTVPLRIRAAWERNDPDVFAEVFLENGSMLVGDEQLKGREEIRSYMASAFAAGYKGARISEEPLEILLITDDAAIAVTRGGILWDGETTIDPAREYRAMWVVVRQNGDWRLASLQTSPLGA
jgi:uncharacterized protein (TIGR02246 family)